MFARKNSTVEKKCMQCKGAVRDFSVTTKDGRMYHQSCFTCAKCREPLSGAYLEVPPTPTLGPKGLQPASSSEEPSRLCEPCYTRVGKSLCALCNKIIIAGGLVALNQRYHVDHFVCTTCYVPLPEGFFEYQGKPYCRLHKAQMVGLVCLDCKAVITEGTYVTALDNKHWHTSCFKCSRCSSKLNEYFEKGEQVLCVKCNEMLNSGMLTLAKRAEETKVDSAQLERDYAAWIRTPDIKAWPANAPGATTTLVLTDSGWPTELGSFEADYPFPLTRDSLNVNRRYYKKYLSNQDPPIVVSIECKTEKVDGSIYLYRTLVRTYKGDDRLLVPIASKKPSKRKLLEHLKTIYPELGVNDVVENSTPDLVANLIAFEEKQLQRNFKFGVLYCKAGQKTEDEMYANVGGSPAFDEFLEFLGTKIELAQWSGYSGGLGTKDTSTGTYSIFTKVLNKFDIMFHVSTYIPFNGADTQQVERKRHLGNDVGLIIFKEGGSGEDGFDPLTISSHFNHVFIIVQKVPQSNPTAYRVSVIHKPGVKPHMPFLPFPAKFTKGEDLRNFLLAKLINGGLAALHSPEFLSSLRRTRKELLAEVVKKP